LRDRRQSRLNQAIDPQEGLAKAAPGASPIGGETTFDCRDFAHCAIDDHPDGNLKTILGIAKTANG
jgi:hypothetical protein